MKQAIAGVAPSDLEEVTVMTVWPSLARLPLGRLMGRLCGIGIGIGPILTIGNLLALLFIPLSLALFIGTLAPPIPFPGHYNFRYRLTNRRVIELQDRLTWIARGMRFLTGVEIRSVSLDRFDAIDVVVRPGQEWYPAGDLIFRLGNVKTFRLEGVSRPETFRHTCLKAHQSYVGVQKARQRELAAV